MLTCGAAGCSRNVMLTCGAAKRSRDVMQTCGVAGCSRNVMLTCGAARCSRDAMRTCRVLPEPEMKAFTFAGRAFAPARCISGFKEPLIVPPQCWFRSSKFRGHSGGRRSPAALFRRQARWAPAERSDTFTPSGVIKGAAAPLMVLSPISFHKEMGPAEQIGTPGPPPGKIREESASPAGETCLEPAPPVCGFLNNAAAPPV